MRVVVANNQTEITDNFLVRGKVFVVEQEIDYEIEFDGLDNECVLFTAYLDDLPIGSARLYKNKHKIHTIFTPSSFHYSYPDRIPRLYSA